ncbi:unnamed protein product [Arabidopsis arenosa]|uniref:Uncharacterized protein n=1 Tax=Arabidopsis arenosa TaxID=38785 RepID=A0A8S2A2X8_ARAAE|nr:unnamed protein product [Arabidopsis arenosa]
MLVVRRRADATLLETDLGTSLTDVKVLEELERYDAIEFTSDRLQLVEKVFRLEPIPLNPPFHLPFSSTPLPPLKAQSSDFVPPVQACDLFARLDGKVWWKEGSREFQMCSTPLAKQALVLSPFLGAQDGRR